MHRLVKILVPLTVMSTVVAGCGGTEKSDTSPASFATGGTFTMAIPADLGSYDPYRNPLVTPWNKLAYDSLVNQQPDGKFVSGLAKTWQVNLTSGTFVLKSNITCSDGTPLKASQVAADLNYVGDPKNGSGLYGSGVPAVPFTAIGDDATGTVKIEMSKPFPFLLNTMSAMPIVCEKGFKDPSILKSASDGTGPFVLTSAVAGQSYTFTVRQGYSWGPDGATTSAPGTPKTVVLRVVENDTTAANLLLSGELNLANISGQDWQRVQARGLKRVDISEPMVWLWPNQLGSRPTADIRVRQALVHALNFNDIVAVSTSGRGQLSTGLAVGSPRTCPPLNDLTHLLPGPDMNAANGLLDEAGWVKGSDGIRSKGGSRLTIDLHYPPEAGAGVKPAAELIAKTWGQIGVDVKLTSDTYTVLSEVMFQTGNYDVVLAPISLNLPSQATKYLAGPVPPNGSNFAGIRNDEYDRLAAQAGSTQFPQTCDVWDQAEEALYRNVDVVPISEKTDSYFLAGSTAEVVQRETPIPTSIRVLK